VLVTEPSFPFADLALSRRLEHAEALSNARFVDACARLFPDRGSTWVEVAGARAMFDGPSSPMTQTFGLGLFQPATAADLEAIEAFYAERGAPVFHEVSPLADAGLPALLTGRGYRPFEFSSVLYRPIDLAGLKPRATPEEVAPKPRATGGGSHVPQGFPGSPERAARGGGSPAVRDGSNVAQGFGPAVRLIEKGEEELYARISAAGWNEFGLGDFILEIGRVSGVADGLRLFLAELDGKPIAAGALGLCDGVAHLAGASTIPEGRKRGAQFALLDHRLRYAAAHGCDVALMAALPGSGSHRNAERNGFRIAYTRIKWTR
jgi:GNAT superfamily N-acetyltransferase